MSKSSIYILLHAITIDDLSNFLYELGLDNHSDIKSNLYRLNKIDDNSLIIEEDIKKCLSILKDKEDLFIELSDKYNISSSLIVDATIDYDKSLKDDEYDENIIPSYALSVEVISLLARLNLTYDLNININAK